MPTGQWSLLASSPFTSAESSLFQKGPGLVRMAKVLGARWHFAATAGAAGAWLVFPALSDSFKGSVGLGPKVDEAE